MKRKQLILDRYQPVEQAGSGGFGTVVKAWDTRIQRWVAIKTIQLSEHEAARANPDALNDPYALTPPWEQFPADPSFLDAVDARHEREARGLSAASLQEDSLSVSPSVEPVRHLANLPGLDEARTAAMLQDPNIVQVYDFEVQDSVAYLIMEYVDGISLSKLLRDFDDKLTLNQIAAVFASVAHALAVAHSHSVLHLDIKPDNVLIDKKGCVKVTDFGLATLADSHGTGFAGGGTIGYMPPEQIDQQPLDERCDEWALASVAYEMLSGENPFRVRQLAKARVAIEESELVLPSLCWDDLDAQADDALFMALDPCRDERFESVEDFADEFLPLLGDPESGQEELSQLVNYHDLEEEEAEDDQPQEARESVHVRISRNAGALKGFLSPGTLQVLAHVMGFAGGSLVAFFALSNMPMLAGSDGVAVEGSLFTPQVFVDQPLFWVLLLGVAAAGAARPAWGALAAFQLLGVAYIANGQPVAGVLFMFVTALWWYFVARLQHAVANVAFMPPVAGAFGLGQLTPLFGGFCLPLGRALVSAAYALIVAAMMAACTQGSLTGWGVFGPAHFGNASDALASMLANPPFWCVAASWLGSAAVVSVLCRRRGRAAGVIGAGLGACLLFAGMMFGAWLNSGGASLLPPLGDAVSTAASSLLFMVAVLVATASDEVRLGAAAEVEE